jgi:hypothetical protein
MVFKDRVGKDLKVGQKGLYLDNGMLDVEILEIEHISIMDGSGARTPRITVKMHLNLPPAPPEVAGIMIGNLRIVEDAPVVSSLSSTENLTRH